MGFVSCQRRPDNKNDNKKPAMAAREGVNYRVFLQDRVIPNKHI